MKTHNWLAMLGVLSVVGCDGSTSMGGTDIPDTTPPVTTNKQSDAVTAASSDYCDAYTRCGEVGSGKTFTTRQACTSQQESYWNDKWPTAQCDGKINLDKLQICRDGLKTLSCNNLTDELKTVNTKCPQSEICTGP